jgi:hypothetical protein
MNAAPLLLLALACGAHPPDPKLTILYTGDDWGEIAPCG